MEITRFTDDSQPGWVECRLTDARGIEWLFEEKVPVVSSEHLDAQSEFPRPGFFACRIIKHWCDEIRRSIVTIDLDQPWGIETSTGLSRFDVLADQLAQL